MKATRVEIYCYEHQKHLGISLYEWLLEHAKKRGLHGGSAFRAIAGFGRHGKLHEERFFELGANLPIKVEFIASKEEIESFLKEFKDLKLELFFTLAEIEIP